ncbi:MAG: methyltransferase domain-containing protein [Bryobacterales bacterium]|nr:methyltransferase domain-containing protein [Bryobacterales bacterium]
MGNTTAQTQGHLCTHTVAEVDAAKQPGHWLLASLGKRVLRPGGLELTRILISRLRPTRADDIVEFAPGLGVTARMTLACGPASYTGIERETAVAAKLQQQLGAAGVRIVNASADHTGLEDECASLVYGEAMLSMQTPEQKRRILAEAFRILKPGGRYGIHELALLPDSIDIAVRKTIEREMSMNIHVGVRPATFSEWRELMEETGFKVTWQTTVPMHLLEPKRVLADEGLGGVLRIAFNLLRRPKARQRVLSMRRMFRRYTSNLTAVAMVCEKPAQ